MQNAGTAVEVSRQGGAGVIKLNEPDTLNVLSLAMRAGLAGGIESLLNDPDVRSVLIIGTGRAFCAGGDIRLMDVDDTAIIRIRLQSIHRWIVQLLRSEKPIVTAVNGIAAGAGFSLALLGDVVCAAENARFKASFLGIGAVPDLALTYTLPRAIGATRARDILLTNREVSASEALAMGFVSRLFPVDGLFARALELAQDLAASPTPSTGLTKRFLQGTFDLSLEALLEQEALAQAAAFGSSDFKEGIGAFREKRRAQFGNIKTMR
jgi:2-(1,2-epoxy-1,2-dihydrophenyl)acetyl-CoA isomerase